MQKTLKKPILTTYNEVKIDKTTYRLTSKFEGNKNLKETLKRLAVKQITKVG